MLPTGRDMGDLIRQAGLLDSRHGIAAADDAHGATSATAFATPKVPFANLGNSNTPMGPFQTTVPASFNALAVPGDRLRSNIQDAPAIGNRTGRDDLRAPRRLRIYQRSPHPPAGAACPARF